MINVKTSVNGRDWVDRIIPVERTMPPGFSDIQEVNGRFVGVYGTPYYELAETDASERILSIAGAGEDHLAMDRLGRIFRLEENRWQWIARVPHDAPLRLAALNEETWLVAGGRGKLAVYRNGTWEWPVKPAPDFDLFFDAVADDGNGRAVIAGANGALFYSDDLNQWHPAQITGGGRARPLLPRFGSRRRTVCGRRARRHHLVFG